MKKILIIIGYALAFLVLFRLFLTFGFPNEALCNFIESQVKSQTGITVKIEKARLSYLDLGVNLYDVKFLRFSDDQGLLLLKLDKVSAGLPLIPTLLRQKAVDFYSDTYDGTIKGQARLEANQTTVKADVVGIDLTQFKLLKDLAGINLGGRLHGTVELSLDPKSLAQSSGSADMQILAGFIDKSTIFGIELPKADFSKTGDVAIIKLSTKKGTLSFEDVRFKGSDMELQLRGNIRLGESMDESRSNCNIRLGLQPQYKQQLSPVIIALLGNPEQTQFAFNLTGKLSEIEFEPTF